MRLGPRPVRCSRADVDLRVGGRYRIDNLLPTGELPTMGGEFTLVERPSKLVYTWSVTPGVAQPELVTVRFDPKGPDLTEVVVTHERIESAAVRDSHATDGMDASTVWRFMSRRIDSRAHLRLRFSAKWPLTC